MEKVKQKFPWISYADLWTLAGAVAVEDMGGDSLTPVMLNNELCKQKEDSDCVAKPHGSSTLISPRAL